MTALPRGILFGRMGPRVGLNFLIVFRGFSSATTVVVLVVVVVVDEVERGVGIVVVLVSSTRGIISGRIVV